jgi:hypothetical protein
MAAPTMPPTMPKHHTGKAAHETTCFRDEFQSKNNTKEILGVDH